MDRGALLDLYEYMAWADAEVWRAVLACEAAAGDARIQDLLQHMYMAGKVYLRVWRGEPADEAPPEWDTATEVCAWGRAYLEEVREFVATRTEEAIREPMPASWMQRLEGYIGPAAGPVTLGDTMAQVPLHSQHHRGQVCTRLRELGVAPPLIDYVVWVWQGRPQAAWGR